MNWLGGLLSLFGVGTRESSGGTNVVGQVADVVDNYKPGEVTKHNMSIEDVKVEDASQDSARRLAFTSHGSWFDVAVDGLNRLPRPLFALWAFGILIGVVPVPAQLMAAPPLVLNILWTVIGFYFGIRTVSQDLPDLIKAVRGDAG